MKNIRKTTISNLELENNFMPINISINDMEKNNWKKELKRRKHLQKTLGMIGTIG